MNRRFNKTQRNYIIMGLCAILVIMGVGYAAFQSQLKISGTSNIASNFLVRITDIGVSSKSGGAADKSDVTKVTSDTSATFGTTLQSPGDSITYNITIENQGSIDAVLKTITKTDTNNSAIIFETSGVSEGDALNIGETATMQVTVTYNPSVTSQPTNLESTLNVTLDYEQTEGIVTPPTPSGITPADLKTLAVTSGDGLYADEYESGRYIYKGANPNNYITFNNEAWRIISVESDGTMKIMRNESIGNAVWDESSSNNWAKPTTLNNFLNENYIQTLSDSDKIVSHTWNIGSITSSSGDLETQIIAENKVKWTGKIALPTVSEFIRTNNWMNSIILTAEHGYLWTLSPVENQTSIFFAYNNQRSIDFMYTDPTAGSSPRDDFIIDVSPALYLS